MEQESATESWGIWDNSTDHLTDFGIWRKSWKKPLEIEITSDLVGVERELVSCYRASLPPLYTSKG